MMEKQQAGPMNRHCPTCGARPHWACSTRNSERSLPRPHKARWNGKVEP